MTGGGASVTGGGFWVSGGVPGSTVAGGVGALEDPPLEPLEDPLERLRLELDELELDDRARREVSPSSSSMCRPRRVDSGSVKATISRSWWYAVLNSPQMTAGNDPPVTLRTRV